MLQQVYTINPTDVVNNPRVIALNVPETGQIGVAISNFANRSLYVAQDNSNQVTLRVPPGRVSSLVLGAQTTLYVWFGPIAGVQNYSPSTAQIAVYDHPISAQNWVGDGFTRQVLSLALSGAAGTVYDFLGFNGTGFSSTPTPSSGGALLNIPPGKKSHVLFVDSSGSANQPTSYSIYAGWQSTPPISGNNPLPSGGLGEAGTLLQTADFRGSLGFPTNPRVTHPIILNSAWPGTGFFSINLIQLGLDSMDYGYLSILFGLVATVNVTEVIEWWPQASPIL